MLDSIPAELKELNQWVVWKLEVRDEKATKVPYSPRTGERAASNDRRTWASFSEAVKGFASGKADGVGFVFSEDDPYFGVDLDKCIDEQGNIAEWAWNVIEQLDTYTEYSPSGKGIHIIGRGTLPEGRRRTGQIEMYDRGRYFTMTGRHLPHAATEIGERTEALATFHAETFPPIEQTPTPARQPQPVTNLDDEALLAKAQRATNGPKFDALWRGDLAGHESRSEADLALCNMLAFWTGGDADRVDTLFRQSGLMRDKWDEKHFSNGNATYGQGTIAKAIGQTTTFYSPGTNGHNGSHATPAQVIEDRPDYNPEPIEETSQPLDMPALPGHAQAIYAHARPGAGAWLDEYIAFASKAAPMTPNSFHEAAGLFAGSVAIARRLVLRVSTTAVYPNLFMLFVAPSTIYSKTTGLRVLMDLFAANGMQHFLLPQRMTPEAMTQELSLGVPTNLNLADQEARASWIKERAIASQRGWAIDEASSLFDSLKRDFNSGLMPMMLNLYECPDKTTEQTVGRWRVTVHKAYVSFFGAATPAAMNEHFGNSALWTNGLWARFALIVPDQPPRFQFFPERLEAPAALKDGLRRLAELFPMPEAELVEVEDPDGTRRKVVDLRGEVEASHVLFEDGVWEAWEAYTLGLHELVLAGGMEVELHSSYGRLHMHAMKIAMILAAMDSHTLPVRVGRCHFARAQQICERWRASIHQIRHQGAINHEETAADKILTMLLNAGADGLPTREIYRSLNKTSKEIRPLLDELVKQGRIEPIKVIASNGRGVEMWRRTLGTQAVDNSKLISGIVS